LKYFFALNENVCIVVIDHIPGWLSSWLIML